MWKTIWSPGRQEVEVEERMRVRDPVPGEHGVARLARHRGSGPVTGAVVDDRQRDAFEDRVQQTDLRDLDAADLDDRRRPRRGRRAAASGCGSFARSTVVRGARASSRCAGRAWSTATSSGESSAERGRRRGSSTAAVVSAAAIDDAERAEQLRSIASSSCRRHPGRLSDPQSPSSSSTTSTDASTAGRASICAIARFGSFNP